MGHGWEMTDSKFDKPEFRIENRLGKAALLLIPVLPAASL
jgi:hypothetical protein